MRRVLLLLTLLLFPIAPTYSPAQNLEPNALTSMLSSHQSDLASAGLDFLITEATKSDFFLLGELHGDNEIPTLLTFLWPAMWKHGYRHVAAEISPWAADQLASGDARKTLVHGLWTQAEADLVSGFAPRKSTVLWGCDMEEMEPQAMINSLAAVNPHDSNVKHMASLTAGGYKREMAPRLLEMAGSLGAGFRDLRVNDLSLRDNLLATLEIDDKRLFPETKMDAQNERELLIKQQFLEHYRLAPSKVLIRFGRNHLHRGLDARGISTLGNFLVEYSIANGKKTFNVGAFGAGGKAALLGETWDANERGDEPTFDWLAGLARYPATVFDLRPLRPLLHAIPQEKRSALEKNLIYWADSYDALICYRNVTPRAQ